METKLPRKAQVPVNLLVEEDPDEETSKRVVVTDDQLGVRETLHHFASAFGYAKAMELMSQLSAEESSTKFAIRLINGFEKSMVLAADAMSDRRRSVWRAEISNLLEEAREVMSRSVDKISNRA